MLDGKQLSKQEVDRIIDTVEKFIDIRLRQLLGNRKIEVQEFKELGVYWLAYLVNRKLYNLTSERLALMSEQDILELFFAESQIWTRGLEDYSQMAGVSLGDLISEKLQTQSGVSVLDIGSGQAFFQRILQEKYGQAVDCYAVANIQHSGTENIKFELGLAEILPETWSDKFDIVTCFESSMYFWDQRRAFHEALRVLNPKGHLFYGTNNLKTSTNSDILEQKLGLNDFSYTCPETSARAGQTYKGVWGKYVSKFIPFMEYIKTLTNDNNQFKCNDKTFELNQIEVSAWCSQTLQVKIV